MPPRVRPFTVIGVYEDNGYQRAAFVVRADTPETAEDIAVNDPAYGGEGDFIVAGILEGEHQCVDVQ